MGGAGHRLFGDPALPALADELVATRPDILLTPGDASARLLAQKTKTIPVVFAISQDPVGSGFAASLRQPGGNVTGLTTLSTELSAKRLQLLKEAFPRVAHVALLFEPGECMRLVGACPSDESNPAELMRFNRVGSNWNPHTL